jgi:YHS domain-containing protein
VGFFFWLLVGYLVYRMVRGKAAPEIAKESTATETFQDPVCGVYLSEADAVVGNLEGKRYHFCSMICLKQFEKDQQKCSAK